MNKDFYVRLGKKIKDRRIKLHLTQRQVCGTYITRNMLSRIESGSAHPSLDTLLYLSDTLSVPASYFVSVDEKTEAQYKKITDIAEIRRLFASGQYKRCSAMCKTAANDDEINYIFARCELALADECFKCGRLASAERHITAACDITKQSQYPSESVQSAYDFYKHLIDCIKNSTLPDPVKLLREGRCEDTELLLFVCALSASETDLHAAKAMLPLLQKSAHISYLTAKILIKEEKYRDAAELLKTIPDGDADFFTQYFATSDLELCAQKTDDYKSAYTYAKQRLTLNDKFGK